MSWAGPEDIYLSTSLASYLDTRHGSFVEDLDVMFDSNICLEHYFLCYQWLAPHSTIHDAEKLLVLLRDGRKLMGTLRSFDQFANAVLEGACDRVIVGDLYCDIPLGLYVIRGENVVLIGELDLEREELPPHMTCVSAAEIRRAQKAEREARDLKVNTCFLTLMPERTSFACG